MRRIHLFHFFKLQASISYKFDNDRYFYLSVIFCQKIQFDTYVIILFTVIFNNKYIFHHYNMARGRRWDRFEKQTAAKAWIQATHNCINGCDKRSKDFQDVVFKFFFEEN